MTPLERAAVAWATADAAYQEACARYRKSNSRGDLERTTPEEQERWETTVVPLMPAVWKAEQVCKKMARELLEQMQSATQVAS